jgi:hypothetical protein
MNYSALSIRSRGTSRTTSPVEPLRPAQDLGHRHLLQSSRLTRLFQQAEQRIFNSVQFPNFRKNQTGVLSPSNQYLEAPPDFLASYSLAVITNDSYEYLLNKDVNYIRAAYPNPTVEGIPKYYAQFDDNTFILGPTPDAAYTVEMHYFYYPESITGTDLAPATPTNTTWLGDNFSSALLYGALVEAYTYMKGEADIVAAYNKRYEEAMILAKRLGDGMERRDAYRSGQVRMTVN